jgi:hypothetical protein
MTDTKRKASASPWARLGVELPSDVEARSVLLVGPLAGSEEMKVDAAKATRWDPAVQEAPPAGPFDLVVCAAAVEASPHPANLLAALCDVMAPGATLFLHSRVLTDPEQSTYARFIGAKAGIGDAEWVPGRLALRWTVETNGFDVDGWIDPGSVEPRGEGDAYLVATRTVRTPSLILATPVPVDGPSQESGAR